MTRDEALELFNNLTKKWVWCKLTQTDQDYSNYLAITADLQLERRKTQRDFFYFQSTRKLTDKSKLYGLWLQAGLKKLLEQYPDCKCLEVEMPDKGSPMSAGADGNVEAHIAKVDISKDKKVLNATNENSLSAALSGLNDFIMRIKDNKNVQSEVKLFNESVDIDSYAQDRLQCKSHAGKTYNKVYTTAQQEISGTLGNDISPLTNLARNLIYFGAPGTGKSFKLKENVKNPDNHFIDKDENGKPRYERVTFYPTYSYAQFVGCYKPVMKAKSDVTSGEEIVYEFVPGPFLRILVKALNDTDHAYCLVIEEINRANAAAVFGDVFQLLDRSSSGESEYAIAVSEDVKKFLKDNGIEKESLRIPANMYIWATMNSADQGVFPLDTAFKRRWEFEYVDIDNGEDKGDERKLPPNEWIVEGKKHKYLWNEVRKYINGLLSDNGVNEDKQMGARFVTASKAAEGGKLFSVVSSETFKSKVLMYLWEDAARMCRQKIFANGIKTFSKLQDEWDDKGVYIFLKKDGQDTKLPKDLMPSKPDEENNDEVGKTGTEG